MSRRLVLTYLTLTLLVLVLLEVPLALSIEDRERARLTAEVERDAVVLASFTEDALDQGHVLDARPLEAYAERTGGRVVLVDDEGIALVDTDQAPDEPRRSFATRPELMEALAGRVATGTRASETLGTRLLYVAVPVASGGEVHGALRVTHPTSEVDRRVRRSWFTLAAVGGVSLLAAGVVGAILARQVVRPLRRLERAASALGAGQLDVRASTDAGPAEVRAVAAAFDDMAARLQEVLESQEAFIGDASHQLRNPLTALRLRIENLAAERDDIDVEPLLEEVARLSRMVDGLLVLARADRVAARAGAVAIDAGAMLRARAVHWAPLAVERDVRVVVDAGKGVSFSATPDRVVQVLDNVIANALDVAPEGTSIELQVVAHGDRVAVHVVDHGPGMSAEERERAFDRFWRGDAAVAPGSLGGAGLGLAIVRKLVVADGGEVRLGAVPGGGLDVTIEYPR